MALRKYHYNICAKPYPAFPATLLSNVFIDMWSHRFCFCGCCTFTMAHLCFPWQCELKFVSHRQSIMKLHHSYTTPQAAKGKNCVSLFFFYLVTAATGEQGDGNLLLADIRSSFPPLIPPPQPPRELQLHPLTSTSKEINKHIVFIGFFFYLLARYREKYRIHLLLEVQDS